MTREEREELIERLRAENAETLADLAEREARTAAGLDEEWRVPDHFKRDRQIIERQSSSRDLIYKVRETVREMPLRAPDHGSSVTYMSDEQQRPWNDWLWDHFGRLAEVIGAEVGVTQRQQGDDLRALIEEVRSDLQSQIDELRAIVEGDSNDKSRVIDLPTVRLKGNVDAA